MTTPRKLTLSDENGKPTEIIWVDIHRDGSEQVRSGVLWSQAPLLAGMVTWWATGTLSAGRTARRVAQASRRHRVGREVRGVYVAGAGRYVDVGEMFSETDERSRFFRMDIGPRTSISGAPRTSSAAVDLRIFERLIATYETP